MKATLPIAFVIVMPAIFAIGNSFKAEKPPHRSQRFVALGDLPGGNSCSAARGISADGSVVVGYSCSEAGIEAFRWTQRSGMLALGFPEAFAISADGSTVVGYRRHADVSEPVCWTQHGGLHGLGNIGGYIAGAAFGASADGSLIVGSCETPLEGRPMAFRWTRSSGTAAPRHPPKAIVAIEAHAVSSGGNVIVGEMLFESYRRAAF